MLANVFTKSVRDRWVGAAIAAFTLGLLLIGGMAVYRDVDLSLYYDLPQSMLALMGIVEGGGAGGLAYGAIYGTMGAITIAGVAISMGSASIAGEERQGTLGLLLGNPKSRTYVIVSKMASMGLLLAAASLVLWAAGLLAPELLGVDTAGMHIGVMCMLMGVNAAFYGFLALAVGGWTGNVSVASGTAVAVMMISFLASGILPLVDSISGLAKAFPWYYFSASQPLYNGIDWGHLAVLLAGIAVLAATAVIGVNRRDLRGGGGTTLVDRLRANPLTQKLMDRIAGSARVSRIAVKTGSEHQGLLFIVSAVLFYTALLVGPMYALIDDALTSFAAGLPDALLAMVGGADMSTPEGWLQTEVFSLMVPIGLIIVTATIGARALAGEEQNHTMGLLLANPIGRSRIIIEKTITMVAYMIVAGVAIMIGTLLGSWLGGLGVSVAGILAATTLGLLLALVFGGVALAVGAATGRTQVAAMAAAGAAVVAYLIASFLPVNASTEAWASVSPWHYYLSSDPLTNGMSWVHAGVLLVLFLGLAAVSIPLFQRRDLQG